MVSEVVAANGSFAKLREAMFVGVGERPRGIPQLLFEGSNVWFSHGCRRPLLALLRPSQATIDPVSGKLLDRLEVARDFRRRGDHMVTTGFFRSMSDRNSSMSSGSYCDGLGGFSFLYWDIELEP